MTSRPHPFSVVTPIVESWRRLLLVFVLAGATTFAVRYVLVDRRYEARATLAAINTQQIPGGALGGLAGLASLNGQMGFTATSDIVAQVLASRQVLLEVGLSPVDSGRPARIIDRLTGPQNAPLRLSDVQRLMGLAVNVSIDRKTGLLNVSAKHADSALARRIVEYDVAIGAKAFTGIARKQAASQRAGQEERVSVTAQQLRDAEARQVAFLRANRMIAPFSAAALERQSLERAVEVAQRAYSEAVSAREAAYARELEQTPAVVVVDPVPPDLPPTPRYNLFYALAMATFAAFVYISALLLREGLTALASERTPRGDRLVAAVRRIPLLRRLAPAA